MTVDTLQDAPADKQHIIGNIGSNVTFDSPYLQADLCFIDATAIAGIGTDQVRELSCSYRYIPVMESGVFDGEAYDGIMTQIRGNHLALVEAGRAGPDVLVADSDPFKGKNMAKPTKLGAALMASLFGMSPVLAADSSVPGLLSQATRKTFKRAEVEPKLLALDATIDPAKLGAVFDSMLDMENDPDAKKPVAKDADPDEDDDDEETKAKKKADKDKAATDGALTLLGKNNVALREQIRAENREANVARADVRETVGDVLALDTADEIYRFAMDKLPEPVDHEGIDGTKALRSLYLAHAGRVTASDDTSHVAMDSAGAFKQFPAAARIRRA